MKRRINIKEEESRCTLQRRWEECAILLGEIREGWSWNPKCEEEKIIHNRKAKAYYIWLWVGGGLSKVWVVT